MGKILSRTYADAFGSAFLRETEDSVFLSASNGGSGWQGVTRWQQSLLIKYIPRVFRWSFDNEMQFANKQIDKFIKNIKL